jgi:hypothetical protein
MAAGRVQARGILSISQRSVLRACQDDATVPASERRGALMDKIPIETLAEEMYQMVAEYAGKRNLKAGDLIKEMIARHGAEACSKEDCKHAIRLLMDSARCVYSYLGGSYIQLPPKQGDTPAS